MFERFLQKESIQVEIRLELNLSNVIICLLSQINLVKDLQKVLIRFKFVVIYHQIHFVVKIDGIAVNSLSIKFLNITLAI